MPAIKMQAFSLCPWRSPVGIPSTSVLTGPAASPREAPAALGPCLYLGCGLFKPTKIENGQVVDGMCSIRFIADQAEGLVKLFEHALMTLVPNKDQKSS